MSNIVIDVNETIFLEDFEAFCKCYVPLENDRRTAKKLPPLTDDQITNLFLSLRKKHRIK